MATQTKKKPTTKRKSPAKKGQKKAAEGFPFKNEIIAIVCLALTLFVVVSVWFSSGGTIGNGLSNLLRGLFGDVAFVIPLILIAVIFVLVTKKQHTPLKLWVLGLMPVELAILKHYMYRFSNPVMPGGLEGLLTNGMKGIGGGVIGGMVADPSISLLGVAGSFILFLMLLLIMIVLLFEVSILAMIGKAIRNSSQFAKDFSQSVREFDEQALPPVSPKKDVYIPTPDFDDLPSKAERYKKRRKKDDMQQLESESAVSAEISDDPMEITAPQPIYDPIEADYAAAPPIEDDYEEEYDWFAAASAHSGHAAAESEESDSFDTEIPYSFLDSQPDSSVDTSLEFSDDNAPAASDVSEDDAPFSDGEDTDEEPMTMQAPDGMKIDAETGEVEFVEIDTGELEKKEYIYPETSLLHKSPPPVNTGKMAELKAGAEKLIAILSSFHVDAKVINATRGSSITRYEILPAPGIKVNKITSLDQDIALRLPANNVRMEVLAGSIAVEISNDKAAVVSLREIIESKEFEDASSKLSVALGRDIEGRAVVIDLAKTPHLLIAGATGSGKSVCINTIINSIVYKSSPDEVKLVMVDPKVVELGMYNGIPHLLVPIVTDPRKAAGALCWAVQEMEDRYSKFAENQVRNLSGYNQKMKAQGMATLPQVVIIIDELADLMMVAPGEVQDYICRLAQKARAAGMHLVLATQRPSVDVITGLIKANIPSRIAFAVSSQIDSRTILDTGGAEKLMGKGDMLLMMSGSSKLQRVQGAFVSDLDVENVTSFLKGQFDAEYNDEVIATIESGVNEPKDKSDGDSAAEDDPLFEEAANIAFELGQVSTSLLQRKLRIGYARAGRLIDLLEAKQIISPYDGSNKPRQLIGTRDNLSM